MSLAANILASADTIAQVLASVYIAIAIFSGEQVAAAFKNQSHQIRINPRRYLEYLNLWQATTALILLPVIPNVINDDLPVLALALFAADLAWVINITRETLLHTRIEREFKSITGSVSRLVAWALKREKDADEELKLITVLLERSGNDTNLEIYILKELENVLKELTNHPEKHRGVRPAMLGALRTLRQSISERPLQNPEYYAQLFKLSHTYWHVSLQKQAALHKYHIFQLNTTLAGISKRLITESLGNKQLAYDYFIALKPFLEDLGKHSDEYFRTYGNLLKQELASSPQKDTILADYLADWPTSIRKQITTDTLSR